MTSDNARRRGSAVDGQHDDGPSPTHVVLVVDSDDTVTEMIARTLRDSYTVRTADDSPGAFASSDEEVSVVVLDPAVFDRADPAVVDTLTGNSNCRVAALTDGTERDPDGPFDAHLGKPVAQDALRSTVDRLCHCVVYRDTLDEYFDVASARAGLLPGDPQRQRLDRRIEEIRSRLDDAAATLDSHDIYDAALRESESAPADVGIDPDW
jgi:CheY-like chemotaxis protein